MNSIKQPPSTAPVTSAEFMAWRRDPAAAHRRRHAPPRQETAPAPNPPALRRPAAPSAALRRLEDRQVVNHYAAALLRDGANVEALFGRPGRVHFLKHYLVPERWTVRTDAVFLPRDGSAASVIGIRAAVPARDRAGAFLPEAADLFRLAYQRFTMRQAKVPAERCLLLLLNPDYRNDVGAPDLREMFECHDATRFIDEPAGPGAPPIAAVVAEEAVLATAYLQSESPAAAPLRRVRHIPQDTPEHLSREGRDAIGRILGRETERA